MNLPAGSRVASADREERRSADAVPRGIAGGLCLSAAQHGVPAAEIEYFIGNAEPQVVVCAPKSLPWVQPIADVAKVAKVFTLDEKTVRAR